MECKFFSESLVKFIDLLEFVRKLRASLNQQSLCFYYINFDMKWETLKGFSKVREEHREGEVNRA